MINGACDEPGCLLMRGHRDRGRPLHFSHERGCWFTPSELLEALLVPGSVELQEAINDLIGAHVLVAVALFGWLDPSRRPSEVERWAAFRLGCWSDL